MTEKEDSSGSKTYMMGDVGQGARVAQGENISWVEGMTTLPEGEIIAQMFKELLSQIVEDKSLDEDTREISTVKVQAIAEGFVKAQEDPTSLRRALKEAKAWFGTSATWVGERIGNILKSEAVQKTVSTLAETGIKMAVLGYLG
jgi:hypothetical protein